jgi:hypothetical protein
VSITKITGEFDIGKQIVFQFNSDGDASSQNSTKMPFNEDLEDAVYK